MLEVRQKEAFLFNKCAKSTLGDDWNKSVERWWNDGRGNGTTVSGAGRGNRSTRRGAR